MASQIASTPLSTIVWLCKLSRLPILLLWSTSSLSIHISSRGQHLACTILSSRHRTGVAPTSVILIAKSAASPPGTVVTSN
eukprot:3398555-Amphidinium_carterae.1